MTRLIFFISGNIPKVAGETSLIRRGKSKLPSPEDGDFIRLVFSTAFSNKIQMLFIPQLTPQGLTLSIDM